jgi:hypothetical protein
VETEFAYYLPGVDASKLSDERWAEMYKQLADIRTREAKANPLNRL